MNKKEITWDTCLCFSSAKDTVYNGVIRGKMKAFTESKYCINYFPLEITSLNCTFQNTFLGKVQHSSLIFAHIYSELPCFHKFSSKVSVVHKLGVGAEGGAKLVRYQFKSTAFCNGKFSLTRVREPPKAVLIIILGTIWLCFIFFLSSLTLTLVIFKPKLWENC